MKQLRQQFGPMRKALERGESYLLMYRSKPLAVIQPYVAERDAQHLVKNVPSTTQQQPTNPITMPSTLPDPKMISFGSRLGQLDNRSKTTEKYNPLHRLGMRRAFL